MVIRMNRREEQGEAIVELHGWLSEEILAEFEGLCGSAAGSLHLDLSNLAGADAAGVRALRARAAAGAQLEGMSPYIRLLLESKE